eukprot:13935363-Alexandrium_andersonii.AAC.1
MDQYFVNTYGSQMEQTHARMLRGGATPGEVARSKLANMEAFPYPNCYEPLCFGEPAAGQGGLDLGTEGSLDLDAL